MTAVTIFGRLVVWYMKCYVAKYHLVRKLSLLMKSTMLLNKAHGSGRRLWRRILDHNFSSKSYLIEFLRNEEQRIV